MISANVSDSNEKNGWNDITVAGTICEGGTSMKVNTGDWRTMIPGWIEDKCKHCMLCNPVCPDSSIPIEGDKRLDFNFMHCKGCGICFKVCPFKAITWEKEEK